MTVKQIQRLFLCQCTECLERPDRATAQLHSHILEMAALLNLEGGYILLGVEKDRTVSGLTRTPERAEEWVMEVARVHLRPAAIPYWETFAWEPGKVIGIMLEIAIHGDDVLSFGVGKARCQG